MYFSTLARCAVTFGVITYSLGAAHSQTYSGSRSSDANCNDLRVNCDSKANRADARQNTGAAPTASIGASQYQATQSTVNAWKAFEERSNDGRRSISELWAANAEIFRKQDEEDRKRQKELEERLKTPQGKRDYYAQIKNQYPGVGLYAYRYAVYSGAVGDDAEQVKWMEIAAKQGEPQAQYLWAFWKRWGFNGQKADGREAFEWAAKAAQKGMPQGLGLMAYIISYGVAGMNVDQDAAYDLAKKGCEAKSAQACQVLGDLYFEGFDGVPQDLNAARKAYEQAIAAEAVPGASEYGPSAAAANGMLALMYKNGQGVSKDLVKARQYLLAATKSNLAILENDLWRTYGAELVAGELGYYGFERNTAEGWRILNRTADRGDLGALELLGVFTKNGMPGVPRDLEASKNYFARAAKLRSSN